MEIEAEDVAVSLTYATAEVTKTYRHASQGQARASSRSDTTVFPAPGPY
ncbi:hypothetical protein [Streptomyces chartreusis]